MSHQTLISLIQPGQCILELLFLQVASQVYNLISSIRSNIIFLLLRLPFKDITFTMENGDLELGDVDIIQKGTRSLLECVRNEVKHMESFSPKIYMVPSVIRDLSASSFGPRVVSIGPLHREDENVQAFEKRKTIFLVNLLNRIDSSEHEILLSCMQKVHASMERIKQCYVLTKTYDDATVAKMLVMDACFILEFIYWYSVSDKPYPGNNLCPFTLLTDLVLLENQIPFFFLNEIYECTISKNHPNLSLIQFLHPLLHDLGIFKYQEPIKTNNISVDATHHILSLLHQCYEPQKNIKSSRVCPISIYSAVDLERAGVSIKPYKDPSWVMGMKAKPYMFPYLFGSCGKPTLGMPILTIDDTTELVLRNLIAYQQSGQTRSHITSYVWAMDMLVNTEEDVAKLVESGVLVNEMGSNEEVANIINGLGNGLVSQGFFYKEQVDTLYECCNGYWPKHMARLKRTYFSSPWNMIALLAGTILFALTVVQTIFTIKSTSN
ncbi:hypothetical protein HanRHA438_Chr04g0153961 [Helianthus annuus]|uniref:Uncharacterized protein n=2 Tax=Helianthus annuus TaxID=4232 RepID=A0A251UW17_HELAN|nr:hypothetical protein HanXRQr2_Chr04g0142361 [Helianthus annuus]KAJ0595351.1 hypothetical protein HanHA89_Chr04g0130421 [Helianthus annuus]KAJ0756022.1 hypothetical protein HanLR1_Chr04g0122371 [Helianthus annuus]KAJ0924933.1 hypothetical protein HanRHA438_Chr04g0153961 [Helianthus annuus]